MRDDAMAAAVDDIEVRLTAREWRALERDSRRWRRRCAAAVVTVLAAEFAAATAWSVLASVVDRPVRRP